MTNHVNTIEQLTIFELRRSLVSKAVNKALPLVLISPLLLSPAMSFAAQVAPNPNDVGNIITITTTDVTNDVAFDNLGTIKVEATGLLTNNASLKNHSGGKLNLNGYANHVEGKHNAFTNVGILENSGAINLSAYQNYLVNQGVINNEKGGLINLYDSNAHYNNNLRLDNETGGVLNNKAGATITLENNGANKYFINGGVVNNDGSISTGDFTHFYNSGQFYNNVGASLIVKQARDDNKVGVLSNAGDASLSKWRNSFKLAQTIKNSGTLTLEKLTLTRPLTNLSGGTLTTQGNGDTSVTLVDDNPYSGSLYNSGTWNHNSGQSLKNEVLIKNNTDGTINLSGYLNNAATFTNAGTLTLNSGSDLYGAGTFEQTGGATLLNSQLASDGGIVFTSGLLTGDGRIILSANTLQIKEQAEVYPGTEIGTLSVTGDVSFNGRLIIELDSKEQGNFDELVVSGDISFGVASDAVFDFNFAVTEEFTIDFATAGSISNFSNLNYTFIGLSSGYAVIVDESASKLQLQVRIDTDGDKIADLVDEDDDNDGYTDIDEAANGTSITDANSFPSDNDGDYISDLTDTDDDNDGVLDDDDALPFDADNDGINDDVDVDDDNDGYTDIDEAANGTSTRDENDVPQDNDGDFISDLTDLDDDNDGYSDIDEAANGTSITDENDKPLADLDGDYISDLTDIDDDNDNLIEISTLAELDEIRHNLTGSYLFGSNLGCLSTCEGFELSNDLDFDTNADGIVDVNDAYWNAGEGWQPIGSSSDAFKSHFNGNGFTIKHLTINRPSKTYQGLFGKISQTGVVLNNLILSDVRIDGSSATGGLAGSVNGLNINNITVTGHVKGVDYTGGIIGNSLNSDISLSAHIGNVTAQYKAGGVIGATSNSNISRVYHIGVVDGDESAGGLIGSSLGNISDSFSAGRVTGNGVVGGIVGQVYGSDNGDTFTRNYSVSDISSNTENNTRIGLLFGAIANESLVLTSNYYLQDDVYAGVGASVVVDTSIALNSGQFSCPQHSNDVSCSPLIFTDWDDGTPIWNFGNSLQYPALEINGSSYFLADYDNDGVSDLYDLFPSIPLGALADNDGDGAPDTCDDICTSAGMKADVDDDNDGVIDLNDNFPFDADNDGINDDIDLDDDNDGYSDIDEAANGTSSIDENDKPLTDQDGDYVSDLTDIDDDNDNLIEINTLADLDDIRNNLSGTSLFDSNAGCLSTCAGFELNNDLDFDTNDDGIVDENDAYWNDGLGWLPIGIDYDNQFITKFFGNSFVINNLKINRPTQENIGLFGNVGPNAEIKDIGLENVFVAGEYGVGAIAGRSSTGKYQNIYSIGYIEGKSSAGGLIGSSDSDTIINAYHVGRVYAPQGSVGGIIGDGGYGKYVNIYNIGPVTGSWDVGGLFGTLEDAEADGLTNAYSVGYVSGTGTVGGIVGDLYASKLNNVYSIAKVSGSKEVGAIAGLVDVEGFPVSQINNSYWLEASGIQGIGSEYTIDPTISLSDEQLKCPQSAGDSDCSIVAFNGWDDVTPHWNFGSATQYPSLFLAGENYQIGDFDSDGINDNDDYFPAISIADYPDFDGDGIPDVCNAECLASGLLPDNDADFDGISDDQDIDDDNDDLIEIRTLAELNDIRNNLDGQALLGQTQGCYETCYGFELVNDLDFDTNGDGIVDANDDFWNDGLGWNPLGDTSGRGENYFVSVFEGRGYTIKNLTINRPEQSYIGLFGATDDGAEIYHLHLAQVNIIGSSETGGLAGDTDYTTIDNVSVTGSVSGIDAVGGLVGYSEFSNIYQVSFIGRVFGAGDEVAGIIGCSESDFINSVAHIGPVTGDSSVGGVLGCSYSTLRDVFSTGVITGNDQVGGIAAYQNDAVIKRSVSTSKIVANSRSGAVIGWANHDGHTLEENYYQNGTAASGIGESEISDTTIGLSITDLSCPQSPGDESCTTQVYNDFDQYRWSFGDSNQLPALSINDQWLRIEDYDQDGVSDFDDLFPSIAIGLLTDTDNDGAPDNCDLICLNNGLLADNDDDNDGVPDNDDIFPLDENEYIDSDFDGVGDNSDAFPQDSTESADSDLDGVGDNADALPNNANESIDTDGDGIGNNADTDDDGDGVLDENDSNPLNPKLGGETSVFSDLATQTGLSISGNNTRDIKFSDVDGDNDLDIVAVNEGDQLNKIFLNNGLGDFQYSGVVVESSDELSEGVVLLDIDNDHDQDMIVITYASTTKLYLNDGLGNFSQSAINIGDSEAISFDLVLGDVDKDNDLDLIVANDFSANQLYLNNGDGSFASAVNIGSETGGTYGVVLGDVNGDLYPDLITGETDDQGAVNRLYLNDGFGGFSATGTAIGIETDYSGAVDLGDVDGDLDLDLIVANEGSTNKLYLNNGEGVFSQTGIGIGNETHSTLDIKFVDIDDDDDLDIVTANNLATNKYYLNDGSGNFSGTGINLGIEVTRTKALSIADVDFDGDLDIVFANHSASNSLYLNTTHDDLDTDGDGIADITDTDDDNDGYSDLDEAANGVSFKDPENIPPDFDLDFISDLNDNDDDNDGVNDDIDPAPLDANVYDLTPPLLSIAESIVVAAVDANGTPATDNAISLFLSSANAIDELEGIVSVNHDAPEVFAVGLTTVNFSSADSSGNSTSKTATVTVSDQTIPVITLIGNTAITLSLNDTFIEPGYAAIDNVDGDISANISISGVIDTSILGTTILSYDVMDSKGNIAQTKTRQITVQDTAAPVIIAPSNIIVAAQNAAGTQANHVDIASFLNAANASDDVDDNVTVLYDAPDVFPLGVTTVFFTAIDSAQNVGSTQATVTVVDLAEPVLLLQGNTSITLNVGDVFVEPGYRALDNVDGDLTGSVVVTGTVNTESVAIYTLTYDVVDAVGNTAATQTRQVSVQDVSAPVVIAPNNIVVAAVDAFGTSIANSSISSFLNSANATDDVDGVVAISHDAPNMFFLGTNVVTFMATDSAGNTGSAQAMVTIADQTAPVINLIGNTSIILSVNEVFEESGFSALDNVDGDLEQLVTITGAVDSSMVGTYTLTYNVKDIVGNVADTKTRQVTVQDAAAPVIIAPNNITVAATDDNGTQANHAEIVAFLASANASDDVDPVVVVLNNAPETLPLGTTLVTFTAQDAAGNKGTAQASLTVVDQTPPVINLIGNTSLILSVNEVFEESGFSAIDNVDGDLEQLVTITGDVDSSMIGTYTLTYNVNDAAGNIAETKTRQVTVQDAAAPVIIAPNNITVAATDGNGTQANHADIATFLASANASDDVDVVVVVLNNAPGTLPLGTTLVTFTAQDAAGNIGTAQASLTVVDQTPPAINLLGNTSMTLSVNEAFEDAGFSALDNVDGDISQDVVVSGGVDTSNVGTYSLTYTVSDSAGNVAAVKNRQVTVQDSAAPAITSPNNITVAAVDATGTPKENSVIQTFLTAANVIDDVDIDLSISHDAPSVFPLGITKVTFSASDSAGNVGSAQALVSIVDNTSPVISLTGEVAQTINLLDEYLELGFSASDNVDGDMSQQVIVSGAVDNTKVGIYNIHYDVSDAADNAAQTMLRQITVQDPEFTDSDNDGVVDLHDAFPSDDSEWLDSDNDGEGNNADNDDDNDSVDDAEDSFPLDPTEWLDTDLDGTGNNADTDDDNDGILDAEDEAPLIAFVDSQAPVFAEIEQLTFEATGETTQVELPLPIITDNSNQQPTLVSDLKKALMVGRHQITWTATDDAGNQSTAVQTVIVQDTTQPIFTSIAAIEVNAQGRLTDIASLINVVAIDVVDGELQAELGGDSLYVSGKHSIEVIATDGSGNSAVSEVTINILPEISVIADISGQTGGSYDLAVNLSGEAPNYPVEVLYNIYHNGEVYDEAWLSIVSETQGSINIDVAEDLTTSDLLSVSIEFANNAFVGENNQAQVSIIDVNVAPKLQLSLLQGGEQAVVIDPDNGVVTLQAVVEDINPSDSHVFAWLVKDEAFIDANLDDSLLTFEISPEQLIQANYVVEVTAIENNTAERLSVTQSIVVIVEQLPELASDTDSDQDGVNDSEEGYSDSDGDGIADYLDNSSNTSELPSSDNTQPIQAASGLTMSLGSLVQGSQSNSASLTIEDLTTAVGEGAADTASTDFEAATPLYNFTIDGLSEQGASVAVVIPLEKGSALPADAIYRKYNTVTGWYTFVEDSKNSVSSAKADSNGNCPLANDSAYIQGLNEGDNCIQLIIEDGGANDADFEVNGSVEDPGAVMTAVARTVPVNTAPEAGIYIHEESYDEGSQVILIAQGTDAENDVLSYQWQQLLGPTVTFDDENSAEVIISLPEVGSNEVVELQVTIFDGDLSTVSTTEFTVKHIADTATDTKPEASSQSSGGSITYLFLYLLLMARYQRLKRAK